MLFLFLFFFTGISREHQRRQCGPAQAPAPGDRSLRPPDPPGLESQRSDWTQTGDLRMSLQSVWAFFVLFINPSLPDIN